MYYNTNEFQKKIITIEDAVNFIQSDTDVIVAQCASKLFTSFKMKNVCLAAAGIGYTWSAISFIWNKPTCMNENFTELI